MTEPMISIGFSEPSRDVKPFDSEAWLERLHVQNPWVREQRLKLPAPEEFDEHGRGESFRNALRAECMRRLKAGKEEWSLWAEGMSVLKAELEAAGLWKTERRQRGVGDKGSALRTGGPIERAAFVALSHCDFRDVRFEAKADFFELAFPWTADFESAAFSGEAVFENVAFCGPVTFRSSGFASRARFQRAAFSESVDFRSTVFSAEAQFERAAFSGRAAFRGARFSDQVDFVSAAFSDWADFNDAAFKKGGQFKRVAFSKKASFKRAVFTSQADYKEARFAGWANFESTRFDGVAKFEKTAFAGQAHFAHAIFSSRADFAAAAFADRAQFQNVTFLNRAYFKHATFAERADFGLVQFDGATNFSEAHFEGAVSFEACQGKEGSSFSLAGARFCGVPDFIQAHFQEAPRLDNVEVGIGPTDQPPFWRNPIGWLRRLTKINTDKDLTARWRALRRLAEQDRDHHRALDFTAGELRARRFVEDKPWGFRFWLGVFFELFSNFGRSMGRPVLWWAISALLFAMVYLSAHHAERRALELTPETLADGGCIAGRGAPGVEAVYLSVAKGLVFTGLIGGARTPQTYACLYGVYDETPPPMRSYPPEVLPDNFTPVIPPLGQLLVSRSNAPLAPLDHAVPAGGAEPFSGEVTRPLYPALKTTCARSYARASHQRDWLCHLIPAHFPTGAKEGDMSRVGFLMTALLLILAAPGAKACGVETDCVIETPNGERRTYRIHLPDEITPGEAIEGAILFAHGYRGSAKGVMRNRALLRVAARMDVALIALNADGNDDWVLPGAPKDPAYRGRREIDYVAAVADDAAARFEIPRERMMLTGFSAGGMLVWNVLCDDGGRFAAFAPVAGVFWDPIPESCAGEAGHVIHFHGTEDQTVPMTGRRIRTTSQGDVREALDLYEEHGDYGAADEVRWGDRDCERRTNVDGRVLELCLYEAGHSFRVKDVERAWIRFEELGAL